MSLKTPKPSITRHLSLVTVFQDFRYGLRKLLGMPGFAFIAIATLAIGIGANTTIFSAVNAFMLRPLPFDGADRLVWFQEENAAFGEMSVSFANYRDWRDRNQTFEEVACYRNSSPNVTGGETPERIHARQATANLFPMLGAKPLLGRVYDKNDDQPGVPRTVVLNYGYWQRKFGGQEGAIGQTLLFDGDPYTIIGVMPPDFCFPPFLSTQCDAWTPVGLLESDEWFLKRYNHTGCDAIGKLKRGISLEAAQADLDAISAQLREVYPDANSGNRVELTPYRKQIADFIRPAMLVLMGAVVFVLLIVSANIGNLLLARSTARVQEFAIRNALGAGRIRIMRQVLCEGLILVLLGGTAGILAAMWGLDWIARVVPINTASDPRQFFRIDGNVLLFSLIVTLGSGLLFSLVPALQASRVNLTEAMKDANRSTSGGSKRKRFREILIVSEISLALILLVGAGLMTRSFYRYMQADPGYDPHNVLLMDLSLSEKDYPGDKQAALFYSQLIQRISAISGVRHASVASNVLGQWQSTYYVEGAPIPEKGQAPHAEYNCISPDHFEAMGIRLIEGRYFTSQDVDGSKPVAIVDERFVQTYWPGQSGVGKRLKIHSEGPNGDQPWREIVGVVGHIKHYGVDQSSRESLYLPFSQYPDRDVTIVLRTAGDPLPFASLARTEISALNNQLPVARIRTLMNVVEERSFMRRFTTALLGSFALAAVLLAVLGIYGVMSYSVSQRSHEIGVRMAMGAQVSDVLWLILKGGLLLTGIGVLIGLVGSFALNRFLASQLYGIGALDWITYATVSLVLIAIALLACYIPARRAAKVDPLTALRYE